MRKIVSKDKLSKKARRALNAEKRTQWAFPPVTRVIPNKKKQAQAKKPRPGEHDTGWGFFLDLHGSFGRKKRPSVVIPREVDPEAKHSRGI